MTGDFLFLIPIALAIGTAALGAFIWSLASSQYEDLDGAAERILFDDDTPIAETGADAGESRSDIAGPKKAKSQ